MLVLSLIAVLSSPPSASAVGVTATLTHIGVRPPSGEFEWFDPNGKPTDVPPLAKPLSPWSWAETTPLLHFHFSIDKPDGARAYVMPTTEELRRPYSPIRGKDATTAGVTCGLPDNRETAEFDLIAYGNEWDELATIDLTTGTPYPKAKDSRFGRPVRVVRGLNDDQGRATFVVLHSVDLVEARVVGLTKSGDAVMPVWKTSIADEHAGFTESRFEVGDEQKLHSLRLESRDRHRFPLRPVVKIPPSVRKRFTE